MNSQKISRIPKIGLTVEEILESTTDAFYAVDADWRLAYINHRMEKWWQRPREELLGTVLWDLFPEPETVGWKMHHRAACERIAVHWKAYSPNLKVWVDAHAYPTSDGGIAVFFQDITERTQAEAERDQLLSQIAEEKDWLRAILGSIDDEVWIADTAGKVTFLNPTAQKALGLQSDGMPIVEIVNVLEILEPDGTPRLRVNTPLLRALKGETINGEEIIRHLNSGELRYRRFNCAPIKDRLGNITGAVAICRDITEEKRTGQKLKDCDERQIFLLKLSDALRPLSAPIEIHGAVTRTAMDYFGADRCYYCEIEDDNAVIRQDAACGTLPSVAGVYSLSNLPIHKALIAAGQPFTVRDVHTSELVDESLRQLCIQLKVNSYLNVPVVKGGKPVGILYVTQCSPRTWTNPEVELAMEIAERAWAAVERVRAEEALRDSERKYRDLFDSIDEGFCIIEVLFDDNDRPLDYRFLEVNQAFERQTGLLDAAGRCMRDMVPDNEQYWFDIYGRIALTGESTRFQESSVALGRFYDIYAFRVGKPEQRQVAILFNDITVRKQMEELLLRQSEDRFQQIFQKSPDIITIVRIKDGQYIDVNQAFVDILGYSREEVVGRTPAELNIVADDKNCIANVDEPSCQKSKLQNFPVNYRAKSGAVINMLCSTDLIKLGVEECRLMILKDITKDKQLEAELHRLDRLNTVGEMAAAIGHEVRNPMTTVRGYLQMMLKKEYATYREQLTTMIEELDRANTIISDFLSLAKNKTAKMKKHNLNAVISALVPLLQAEALHTGHQLTINAGNVPDFVMDAKEIRQLLLNLTRNAFEAMKPGCELTITTSFANGKVVLSVRDRGKGIPQSVLDKLGTPFLTTKDNGTGLGLAVCYRIVERHGAKIDVETSPAGTTFIISFPTENFQ
ncbi:PAS domain S-box protein [Sporomusa sphaeroides]|uniref:histidine kinase n=1 Tax=Sporomusa sphaeroides DSM 2875 TaxID=1337886 RepID=A0ABM9W161_9FIRM|nr:PAS domain S-box protein [Sporomusa sphaeroides]OLS55829.1 sporulation kinase E [Sporomusa sphaeroides DSM 2875]CVK18830.1 Sporulation kinase E [Sporomusa sphaeroides DSM 2875]